MPIPCSIIKSDDLVANVLASRREKITVNITFWVKRICWDLMQVSFIIQLDLISIQTLMGKFKKVLQSHLYCLKVFSQKQQLCNPMSHYTDKALANHSSFHNSISTAKQGLNPFRPNIILVPRREASQNPQEISSLKKGEENGCPNQKMRSDEMPKSSGCL